MLGSTAHYVEGMDPAEGRALLTKLHEWSTQPRFDLLIWDNTGTMHRVDPYPLEENRLRHRTTIEAEELLV